MDKKRPNVHPYDASAVGAASYGGGVTEELFGLITRRARLRAELELAEARKDTARWRELWSAVEADGDRIAALRASLDSAERGRLACMLAAEIEGLDGPRGPLH